MDEQAKATKPKLILTGYLLNALSLFAFPIPLGIAALVVAILNLVRGETGHGIVQIVLAVVCSAIGVFIGIRMA